MKPTEREQEIETTDKAGERKPVVLVSEFGAWARRFIILLLIITIILVGRLTQVLDKTLNTVNTNSDKRNEQICALMGAQLTVTPDNAPLVQEYKKDC